MDGNGGETGLGPQHTAKTPGVCPGLGTDEVLQVPADVSRLSEMPSPAWPKEPIKAVSTSLLDFRSGDQPLVTFSLGQIGQSPAFSGVSFLFTQNTPCVGPGSVGSLIPPHRPSPARPSDSPHGVQPDSH